MSYTNFEFWRKWLILANLMTIGVGFLCAFAGNSIFFELHNQGTEDLFFRGQTMMGPILEFKNWLFGIIGGTIVGFHTLMVFIAAVPYKKKESWAWWASTTGMLIWFFIDSPISYYYGALHNIYLINLVALVLIGLPLAMTAKTMLSKTQV